MTAGVPRGSRISPTLRRHHSGRAARYVRRAIGPLSGMALGAVLSTAATFAIASIFPLGEFGRLSSGLAVASLAYPAVAGGAQAVLLAEAGRESTERQMALVPILSQIEKALARRTAILVLGLAGLTVGRAAVQGAAPNSHMVVGGLLAGAMAFSASYRAALTGLQMPGVGVLADSVARPLSYASVGLLVGYFSGMAVAVMGIQTAGGAIGAFAMRRRITQAVGVYGGEVSQSIANVNGSMRVAMIGELSVRSIRRLDLVWLGLIGADGTAALVALAWKIAEVAVLPVAAMLSLTEADLAGSPQVSTLRRNFLRHWRLTAGVGFATVSVVYIVYIAFLDTFVASATGVSSLALNTAVLILLAGQLSNLAFGPSMQVLVASGHYRVFALLSFLAAVVHAAALQVAGPRVYPVVVVDAVTLAAWSALLLVAAIGTMRRRGIEAGP